MIEKEIQLFFFLRFLVKKHDFIKRFSIFKFSKLLGVQKSVEEGLCKFN